MITIAYSTRWCGHSVLYSEIELLKRLRLMAGNSMKRLLRDIFVAGFVRSEKRELEICSYLVAF